jgi:hypothetical protein
MSKSEWSDVFDSLSRSAGPLERMTLSRNQMTFLEGGIGKLKSLSYLFVEDNYSVGGGSVKQTFELPDELGCEFIRLIFCLIQFEMLNRLGIPFLFSLDKPTLSLSVWQQHNSPPTYHGPSQSQL